MWMHGLVHVTQCKVDQMTWLQHFYLTAQIFEPFYWQEKL